ncbi:hypothetical protein [Kineococcus sp. SYSU DK004]|uniref:hypothetical protein n=1 Tax=Kineococcus sp. SYSU DK004 TaxID=3383125 RepID=UPI003D7EFD49
MADRTTARTRTRTAGLLALPAAVLLLLPACGGDDAAAPAGDAVTLSPGEQGADPASPTTSPDDSPGTSPDSSPEGAPAAPAAPAGPRPASGTCTDVPVPEDGRYVVADAGSAVVPFTDGRLSLADVRAAGGWTTEVDVDDDDEVEVEWRRGQERLDLEVELDDGRVTAQLCADDDD